MRAADADATRVGGPTARRATPSAQSWWRLSVTVLHMLSAAHELTPSERNTALHGRCLLVSHVFPFWSAGWRRTLCSCRRPSPPSIAALPMVLVRQHRHDHDTCLWLWLAPVDNVMCTQQRGVAHPASCVRHSASGIRRARRQQLRWTCSEWLRSTAAIVVSPPQEIPFAACHSQR